MTQNISTSDNPTVLSAKRDSNSRSGRLFLTVISGLMFVMLLGAVFVATNFERGDGFSAYEREAIEVVAMQNEITDGWNNMVDLFNGATIASEADHVALYTASQDAARVLISDSQAVINRWNAIDVPEQHAVSHGLGLEALKATQDGLILFDEFFQNAIDTLVADQIRSEEASRKLVHARELWEQAAEAAAREG